MIYRKGLALLLTVVLVFSLIPAQAFALEGGGLVENEPISVENTEVTNPELLDIDPHTDARFVKNGNSAMDALLTYFVQGGGFKHILAGELNGMATEQSYYALTAYSRFLDGKTALYNMTDTLNKGGDVQQTEEPTQTEPAETTPAVTEPNTELPVKQNSFPWWIMIVVVVLGAAAVVVVVINRKKYSGKQ